MSDNDFPLFLPPKNDPIEGSNSSIIVGREMQQKPDKLLQVYIQDVIRYLLLCQHHLLIPFLLTLLQSIILLSLLSNLAVISQFQYTKEIIVIQLIQYLSSISLAFLSPIYWAFLTLADSSLAPKFCQRPCTPRLAIYN